MPPRVITIARKVTIITIRLVFFYLTCMWISLSLDFMLNLGGAVSFFPRVTTHVIPCLNYHSNYFPGGLIFIM